MFKLKMFSTAILVAATMISAADAAKAVDEKKTEEKKVEAKKVDEKKITPYGHAQFRLRLDSEKEGDKDFKSTFTNKIAYHLGVKATVGSKFSAALQIGNKSIATESIDWSPISEEPKLKTDVDTLLDSSGDTVVVTDKYTLTDYIPFFHLAYAKWNPGPVNISGGIIPLKSNGALDLLERSMSKESSDLGTFKSVSYAKASYVNWSVGTENSVMGLQLGVPILKDDIKLGVDATISLVKSVESYPSESKILWVFNAPFKVSVLSFTPQIALLQNRVVVDHEKDHEFAAGAKIGIKATKDISFGLTLGLSKIDDESTKADTADTQEKKGKYLAVSTGIKAGPGKISAAYKLSSAATEKDDSSVRYHYIDLKYGISAHKNFTIMPRVRFYMDRYADDAIADAEKVTNIRPELILIGKF